ncbi:MAG: hypothetical protein HYX63_01530 [Gammaproteobacteria bacterium]|nr:hypothetical protein [Gammaproteobacteria bacterium]
MPTDEPLNNTRMSPEEAAAEHEAVVSAAVPAPAETSDEVQIIAGGPEFTSAPPVAAVIDEYGPELPYDTYTRLNAQRQPVQAGEVAVYVVDKIMTVNGWLLARARPI